MGKNIILVEVLDSISVNNTGIDDFEEEIENSLINKSIIYADEIRKFTNEGYEKIIRVVNFSMAAKILLSAIILNEQKSKNYINIRCGNFKLDVDFLGESHVPKEAKDIIEDLSCWDKRLLTNCLNHINNGCDFKNYYEIILSSKENFGKMSTIVFCLKDMIKLFNYYKIENSL